MKATLHSSHRLAVRALDSARNFAQRTRTAAFAAPVAAVTGLALATNSEPSYALGAAALAAVSGIEADVAAILAVLVLVVFALVAWAYLKKAR
jgi:hypothetical protein